MKKALVVGASGATGNLLVTDLLSRDIEVVTIVRPTSSLKNRFENHVKYHEMQESITEMQDSNLSPILADCDAVFSCLGHNLTLQGIFGQPKRLVIDSIKKITRVIESLKPNKKIKMVLMNTTGNSNRDIPEKPPLSQRVIITIMRRFLPPQIDNEQAADFLRLQIKPNHQFIEWVVVRPDSLINQEKVTTYKTYPSPIRNVIFNAGTTSRINVANFMANLTTDSELWNKWRGKMPVIYNDGNNTNDR